MPGDVPAPAVPVVQWTRHGEAGRRHRAVADPDRPEAGVVRVVGLAQLLDAVLDLTAKVDVRFLERETGFERGVYSGTITVALVIPDVRVGDTLDVGGGVV